MRDFIISFVLDIETARSATTMNSSSNAARLCRSSKNKQGRYQKLFIYLLIIRILSIFAANIGFFITS